MFDCDLPAGLPVPDYLAVTNEAKKCERFATNALTVKRSLHHGKTEILQIYRLLLMKLHLTVLHKTFSP